MVACNGERFVKDIGQRILDDTFGSGELPRSAVPLQELRQLKVRGRLSEENCRHLKLTDKVLGDHTRAIVEHRAVVSVPPRQSVLT
jgi:hypothetical protein